MQNIEPYDNWQYLYTSEDDERSPFYGREYSEFEFSQTVYNYYIHPQWDEFGSSTLYIKVLMADYTSGYTIIEMLGEWNDAIYNDSDAMLNELEDVTRDLRYAVLERQSRPVNKEQLLELLQRRLAGYSGLSKPAFRVALNNYIMLHAKEICDVSVNEQELNARWDEVI